ncbi:MAG: NAD(P)/FAD-dependent oxidoreductase [Synergistaceae bacterium]|jgi:flavin-dependent dehydrogenase|nr:NAD(P)/FAD-dependent oxidoreductase [Synergistaceae bacterium]
MYDVIVIGGGVTGSIASRQLSSMGYSVLLVDKAKAPREKSCSGLLIKKSIHLIQSYVNSLIPDTVTCEPRLNKGMKFYDENGKEYFFEQDGLNIWRDKFDCWLLKKSQEAGTTVCENTQALSCADNLDCVTIQLKQEEKIFTEQAEIALICTGAISPIRDKLLNHNLKYVVTYQKFLHGTIDLDYHYFYAFLDKKFSCYDAWFNVKDDYLIFGVADTKTEHIDAHYSNFISYMTEKFNAKLTDTGKSEKWVMPHVQSDCRISLGKGKILFAGETAGFLNPMGEGISCCIESGHASALSIGQTCPKGKGVNENDLHEAYFRNTKDLHNYMKRQWAFLGSISTRFRQAYGGLYLTL